MRIQLPFILILLCVCLFSCKDSSSNTEKAHPKIPDTGFIASQGAELFYKSYGSGIPILVLHGGPGMDHSYFLPHLQAYPDRYQFIFFDQRASGKSSWEVDSSLMNMDKFVEDIEAVRKYFNLDKVNVLAHSWGGLLAMWYANQHADNLASLVLVSSVPANQAYAAEATKINQEHFREEDRLAMQKLRTSEGMRKREKATLEQAYKLNFSAAFYNRDYLDSLHIVLPVDFEERQRKLRFLRGDLSSYDLYESLSKVKAPTLILHGDYDASPLAAIEKIHENIPGSQLKIFKNTGHFPFIENTSDFWESLHLFYQKE